MAKWKRCGNSPFWERIDPDGSRFDSMTFINPVNWARVWTVRMSEADNPEDVRPYDEGSMTVEGVRYFYGDDPAEVDRLITRALDKSDNPRGNALALSRWMSMAMSGKEAGASELQMAGRFNSLDEDMKNKVLNVLEGIYDYHLVPDDGANILEVLQGPADWGGQVIVVIEQGSPAVEYVDTLKEMGKTEQVIISDTLESGAWEALSEFGIHEC